MTKDQTDRLTSALTRLADSFEAFVYDVPLRIKVEGSQAYTVWPRETNTTVPIPPQVTLAEAFQIMSKTYQLLQERCPDLALLDGSGQHVVQDMLKLKPTI